MNMVVFVSAVLTLSLAALQLHGHFRMHFSGVEKMQAQIAHLENEIKKENLRSLIAVEQAEDMRQSVASLLAPDLVEKLPRLEEKYQLRRIASVTQSSPELRVSSPSTLLQEGKILFQQEQYAKASEHLENLARLYPNAAAAPEALFLAAECQYQLQRRTPMLQVIEKMMARYPESDLTGFAMLRMTDIYREEGRLDDAREVVLVVRENFKSPQIQQQVESLLKSL